MDKKVIICTIIASLLVNVFCQELDVEKLKENLPSGLIPEGLNTSALPTVEDAKNLFKEKCQKIAGNDEAFEEAEEASEKFKDCIMNLIDVETLQKEIEEAQPNGELDTVFNKYCRRRSTAFECMRNFSNSIEPCLNEKEVASKQTFVKIFTNILDFVCYKDGDQIALFIAEKGPECFNDKKDALTNCINTTLTPYIPSGGATLDNLPQLVMGTKECNDMNTLQVCIIKELESCEESTPANLVESMFKYVRNETPCGNFTMRSFATSVKSSYLPMFITFLIIIGTTIFL